MTISFEGAISGSSKSDQVSSEHENEELAELAATKKALAGLPIHMPLHMLFATFLRLADQDWRILTTTVSSRL